MKVLIIYSERSGHGHKSINAAILDSLSKYEEITAISVNGFSWMGKIGLKTEGFYNFIIKLNPKIWGALYFLAQHNVFLTNLATKLSIKKRFLAQVREFSPDVILTVHGMFNHAAKQLLIKNGLDIPLVSVLADIDEFGKVWFSPLCHTYFYPSEETLELLKVYGLKAQQKTEYISGIPIRHEFRRQRNATNRTIDQDNLKMLIYYPKPRLKPLYTLLHKLFAQTNLQIEIITGEGGKNTYAKTRIENFIAEHQYDNRIVTFGYVKNMHEHMNNVDIVVGKGGPNVIYEACTLGVPIIVFETLPGQEVRNGEYVERHGLGLHCCGIDEVFAQTMKLIENDARLLKQLSQNQLKHTEQDSADIIAQILFKSFVEKGESNA